MSLGGTRWAAVVALAGTVVATTGYAAHAQWDSTPIGGVVTDTNYHCGSHDKPEGVIQGDVPRADITSGRARQGYNCGLALVGHTKLDNDRVPVVHQFTHGPGDQADAVFVGFQLFRDADPHRRAPLTRAGGRAVLPPRRRAARMPSIPAIRSHTG